MGDQRREQSAAGRAVRAQLVTHFDGRPVVHRAQDQAFLGEKAEFVGERSARDAAEHGLHLVESAWTGDVEGGENFDGPS